jgi:CRISPR/Cas system endoribonuclease Cas6 (RAMP superfamily)
LIPAASRKDDPQRRKNAAQEEKKEGSMWRFTLILLMKSRVFTHTGGSIFRMIFMFFSLPKQIRHAAVWLAARLLG